MMKNKQKGFSLIGVLLIIGVLILTAGGVVVWQRQVEFPPTPTSSPAPPQSETIPPLHKEFGKIWVQINPIQCFWNPWEKDWLQSHGNDLLKYPRGDPAIIEQPEKEIIREYYQKRGIIVFDIKSTKFEGGTCLECRCPQGYTLFLLVSDAEVQKMIDLGHKKT